MVAWMDAYIFGRSLHTLLTPSPSSSEGTGALMGAAFTHASGAQRAHHQRPKIHSTAHSFIFEMLLQQQQGQNERTKTLTKIHLPLCL
jgi:hypothetical protein